MSEGERETRVIMKRIKKAMGKEKGGLVVECKTTERLESESIISAYLANTARLLRS